MISRTVCGYFAWSYRRSSHELSTFCFCPWVLGSHLIEPGSTNQFHLGFSTKMPHWCTKTPSCFPFVPIPCPSPLGFPCCQGSALGSSSSAWLDVTGLVRRHRLRLPSSPGLVRCRHRLGSSSPAFFRQASRSLDVVGTCFSYGKPAPRPQVSGGWNNSIDFATNKIY